MKTPQAHVASREEECNCHWCSQWLAAGDWLYEGEYCSSACYENHQTQLKRRFVDPKPKTLMSLHLHNRRMFRKANGES